MTTRDALPPPLATSALPDEPSSISVSVTTPLATLRPQLEEAAPRSMGAKPFSIRYDEAPADALGGAGYGYSIIRDRLRVDTADNRIRVHTRASYGIRAQLGPLQDGTLLRPVRQIAGLFVTCRPGITMALCGVARLADQLSKLPLYVHASCGVPPELPKTVNVTASFAVAVKPNWDLDVSHRLDALDPADACCLFLPDCIRIQVNDALQPAKGALQPGYDAKLGVLNNDVTAWVLKAFANKLNHELAAQVARDETVKSLRGEAAAVWAKAADPLRIDDATWLTINPEGVGISPIAIDRNGLTATVRITARPRVVRGLSPESRAAAPFPSKVGPAVANELFSVLLPVDIAYDELDKAVHRELALQSGGLRFPVWGTRALEVTDVQVSGYGNRVLVRFVLAGDVSLLSRTRITGYLVGTPHYDRTRGQLAFPDLAYTAETADLLVSVAEWIKHDEIRDTLRARLVLNLADRVDHLKAATLRAMNRSYGPVELAGELTEFDFEGIYSLSVVGALRTYVRARGSLRGSVK